MSLQSVTLALIRLQAGHQPASLATIDAEQLHAAVAMLPDQFGRAVRLADLEDRSYDEVARQTGVSRNTVGSRVYRGRALLRDHLAATWK